MNSLKTRVEEHVSVLPNMPYKLMVIQEKDVKNVYSYGELVYQGKGSFTEVCYESLDELLKGSSVSNPGWGIIEDVAYDTFAVFSISKVRA